MQTKFPELDPSIARLVVTKSVTLPWADDAAMVLHDETGRELLRIARNGDVTAPSLEAASLAGQYFVESVRQHLRGFFSGAFSPKN